MNIGNKKIKYQNKYYQVRVSQYTNHHTRLQLKNNSEIFDITVNLTDVFLKSDYILLDPKPVQNGIITVLKKYRIIREVTSVMNYGSAVIPVAKLNMTILKNYDKRGVIRVKEEMIYQ